MVCLIAHDTRDTSLVSWINLQPKLGERQYRVWCVIRDKGPLSNGEISQELGWPINCVTPRVKELRKFGMVSSAGKQPLGYREMLVHVWQANKEALENGTFGMERAE